MQYTTHVKLQKTSKNITDQTLIHIIFHPYNVIYILMYTSRENLNAEIEQK